MIATILAIALAGAPRSASEIRFEPEHLIRSVGNDTIRIALPAGDSATLEFSEGFIRLETRTTGARMHGNRLEMGWPEPGRHDLSLRSFVGRRSRALRVDVVPRRRLDLALRPVGTHPAAWTDSVTMSRLGEEVDRLLAGTGVTVRLHEADPVRLPPAPGFWDPEGDGHLDLLRNDDSLRPAPALDSLVGWLGRRQVVFPNIAIFQSPVRVGWALDSKVAAGDSTLRLANETTFPWRDGRGGIMRYVLQSPAGGHPDTFQVVGYSGDTMKIRTTSPDGRCRYAHDPATDIVLRPGQDNPAFGLSPSWRKGAAPLIVVPDAKKLDNPRQAARVVVHEVCHVLGLHHREEKTNLMSPVLRMDVETPILLPDQILQFHSGMESFRRPAPRDQSRGKSTL